MSLQVSPPDQDFAAHIALVTAVVCRVQSHVFVEITGISESVLAKVTFQRLVTCMRSNMNP